MNHYKLIKFKDNEFELDVNVSPEEDTVWLTKDEIALLFERDRTVISKHINNIYKEGELDVEIFHNKVEVKKFTIKNKYLDKSHTYNYANYRTFDRDCDVLRSLSLECFNSIKDKERYKRIVEKANNYLK